MLRSLILIVLSLYLFLIPANGQLQLVDSSGQPLDRLSPSLFDSNNIGYVVAENIYDDLYPDVILTKYEERWFPVDSSRYEQAIIHSGDQGTIFGSEYPGIYTLVWSNAAADQSYALTLEVTCDDGVHCNGQERYVRGECVPGYLPYRYGPNGEQVHQCYEDFPWAEREAVSRVNDCGPICQPKCSQSRKCGSGAVQFALHPILLSDVLGMQISVEHVIRLRERLVSMVNVLLLPLRVTLPELATMPIRYLEMKNQLFIFRAAAERRCTLEMFVEYQLVHSRAACWFPMSAARRIISFPIATL